LRRKFLAFIDNQEASVQNGLTEACNSELVLQNQFKHPAELQLLLVTQRFHWRSI